MDIQRRRRLLFLGGVGGALLLALGIALYAIKPSLLSLQTHPPLPEPPPPESPPPDTSILDENEWRISVDAGARRGPPPLAKFFSLQGSPLLAEDAQGSNEASRQFERAAWRELDLLTENSALLGDEGDASLLLPVVRSATPQPSMIGPLGPNADLYLDPQWFAAHRENWTAEYGSRGFAWRPDIGYMPRTLSSNPTDPKYGSYPPANYDEWRAVITAAVRYLNEQGIDDPHVALFGELNEDEFNVLCPNGQPCPSMTEPVVREYAKVWAETQRAAKAADSGAEMLAVCDGVWDADVLRILRQDPTQRGLDDFIRYLAEYNAALPPGTPPVPLTNICWQGYTWGVGAPGGIPDQWGIGNEKRMAPMVAHLQSTLQRFGFDPNTPQHLGGWSGGWASPLENNYPLVRYASHLVYNILDLINPGGTAAPVGVWDYYTWNFESADEGDAGTSMVSTIHGQMPYGITPSAENCLRPAYMAFQTLKQIEGGEQLAMQETRPELARSLTVVHPTAVKMLLVNYTDATQNAAVTFERLPPNARVRDAVLRSVPDRALCGTTNFFPVSNPLSTLTTTSANLTASGQGTAAGTIALASNTVALLDIPVGGGAPPPPPTSPPPTPGGGGGGGGGSSGGGGGDTGGGGSETRPLSYVFPAERGRVRGSYSGVVRDGSRRVARLAHPQASLQQTVAVPRGTYALDITTRHDQPGPVRGVVYVNGRAWRQFALDKGDNLYRTHRIGVLQGFQGGTVAFRMADGNDVYDPRDPTNEKKDRNFYVASWKLTTDLRQSAAGRPGETRSPGWDILPQLNTVIQEELGRQHVNFDIWQYYARRLTVSSTKTESIQSVERLRVVMRYWKFVSPRRPRGQ